MELSVIVMWLGFALASYSVVGNDVIQTLGTFLTSNEQRMKWWVLWLFAATIMVSALALGYANNDIDYGRLDKFQMPEVYYWYYLLPPIVLLGITRLGIPVSTTFMILTLFSLQGIPNEIPEMVASVFDTDTKLGGMIQKSLMGYVIAFSSALVIYLAITRLSEKYFIENPIKTDQKMNVPTLLALSAIAGIIFYFLIVGDLSTPLRISISLLAVAVSVGAGLTVSRSQFWTGFQWFTTGFLWFQWLTQDLANIYIYLRGGEGLTVIGFIASVAILLGLLAYIFYARGGAVQQVVREKTNTDDIRSATFIDLIYGIILYIFKYNSLGLFEGKLPMSTTWVFIGLLAGRELGMRLNLEKRISGKVGKMVMSDLAKILFGLVVSVILVFVIKILAG
ncbi:MAG: hypothetical protein AAGI23_16070 [Bacteroidota bacterium]